MSMLCCGKASPSDPAAREANRDHAAGAACERCHRSVELAPDFGLRIPFAQREDIAARRLAFQLVAGARRTLAPNHPDRVKYQQLLDSLR